MRSYVWLFAVASTAALGLLFPMQTFAQDLVEGQVVRVVSGDTIEVKCGDEIKTLRLACIDAPELGQPYGPEACAFATELLAGKPVLLEPHGNDAEGRAVAAVALEDGRDASREIASSGLAWCYDKDDPFDTKVRGFVAKSLTEKKGLWIDAAPLAPWDYRADELKHQKKDAATANEEALKMAATPVYVMSGASDYHKDGCVILNDTTKKKTTLARAVILGFSPCPRCFPPEKKEGAPVLEIKGDGTLPPPLSAPAPAQVAKAQPAAKDPLAEIKQNSIYKEINPQWAKGTNGEVLGISADAVFSNPTYGIVAGAIGLRQGDILGAVNGYPVRSEQDIAALIGQFQGGPPPNLDLTVIRNGQPQNIPINLAAFGF